MMSHQKLSAHSFPRKSLLWLLASLITATVLFFSQGLQVALAVPIEPPDITPPIDPGEIPFVPEGNGFDWSVPSRFGRDDNRDGLIDYHYNSATFQYEKSLLYPESWPMIFDGCRTQADAENGISSTNTYTWVLNGETITGNRCRFTYGKDSPNAGNLGFPAQGIYPVDLTVTFGEGETSPTGQNPEIFHQEVVVKDFLIVSLGDSYSSGEGVPDIYQRYHLEFGFPVKDADAVWQDKRCHRSAKGGPPLAALAIERMDPKTSVTFISYACSGSTIGTEMFDGMGGGDPNQSRGVGILEPYLGQEVDEPIHYSSRAQGWAGYIPSQMGQLQDILIPPAGKSQRQIDALVISGGGNDMLFAKLLGNCVLFDPCWGLTTMFESPGNWTLYSPHQIVWRALGLMPGREADSVPANYDRMATEIGKITPAPLNVYLTQYPDQTRDDNGGDCRMLEDIFWPNPLLAMEWWETKDAREDALRRLNKVIFQEARDRRDQGWVFVDGLERYNLNEDDPLGPPGLFYGHGYCANQNWITRAEESELIQGPLYHRDKTTGTVHPNYNGNYAISQRLLNYMLPNLFPQPPADPPAIGAPAYAIAGLVDEPGTNGWYLGSCEADTCYPKVVLQVVGSAEAGVAGAGVMIDGVDACTVNGVTCRTDGGPSDDNKQYTWNMEINADGIYDFQFNLRDSAGAIATGGASLKVDLHDPMLETPDPFSVDEGGSVVLGASVADMEGSPVSLTWDLDNDGDFETYEQEPTFSAANLDGPTSQTIKVKASDQAGRTATAETAVNVLNVAPALANISVTPGTVNEGDSVTLGGGISDPGSLDTFTLTINWGDGSPEETSSFAAGTKTFSLKHTYADDNPSGTASDTNNISLSLKDDDNGTGTGSASLTVNNLAPSLTISSPDNGALYAINTNVSLNGTISDKGLADTFSCSVDWNDGATTSGTLSADGCTASHSYSDTGVYSVQMTVTDDDSGSDMEPLMVVVYDPSAGFVTGGGWIDSPAGAYKANESLSGRATFGFVSKYQKGASVPTGNTAFEFDLAGLAFSSQSYEWLVVNRTGTNAQFKGSGLINGMPDPNGEPYKFVLWAIDGSPDTFRIKIWWEAAGVENVVYDNAIDQALGGGNIVVHAK